MVHTASVCFAIVQLLTPRQQRFVEEFALDLNQTQAAIRSGFNPRNAKSQGARLMAKQHVRAAVKRVLADRSEEVKVSAQDVLRGLLRIANDDAAKDSDKIAALALLGKHLGMFVDSLDVRAGVRLEDLVPRLKKKIEPDPAAGAEDHTDRKVFSNSGACALATTGESVTEPNGAPSPTSPEQLASDAVVVAPAPEEPACVHTFVAPHNYCTRCGAWRPSTLPWSQPKPARAETEYNPVDFLRQRK